MIILPRVVVDCCTLCDSGGDDNTQFIGRLLLAL